MARCPEAPRPRRYARVGGPRPYNRGLVVEWVGVAILFVTRWKVGVLAYFYTPVLRLSAVIGAPTSTGGVYPLSGRLALNHGVTLYRPWSFSRAGLRIGYSNRLRKVDLQQWVE